MTPDATCPACRLPVHPAGPSHPSADGPVRYARCPCGRWVVLVAGSAIAAAGPSDLATPHVPARAARAVG
ncbi:MAG: hypothetical protein ACRDQB_02770 [Thermocrispum sp.]